MMELKLIDHTGESTANIAAPDEVFGRAYNEALIHQVVAAYLANGRSGNGFSRRACSCNAHRSSGGAYSRV